MQSGADAPSLHFITGLVDPRQNTDVCGDDVSFSCTTAWVIVVGEMIEIRLFLKIIQAS